MKATQKTTMPFYQSLGKLFYAIAASDKIVRTAEYDALKKIVQSEWSKMDDLTDEFGADAAFQIEIVFDWLDYEELTAEEAFSQFKTFIKENNRLFTDAAKLLIWKTSNIIADSFSGKNKSEVIMLTQLKIILAK